MTEIRGIQALEIWCRRLTSGYPGVNISNLTTSFRDGLAFCAIIHHYRPDLIDFDSLSKDNVYKNNALAFQVAEQELGIPALLDPEDMVRYPVPDRLSVSTYLAQFYHVFGGKSSKSSPSTPSKRPSPEKTSATPGSTKKIFSREFNMTQDRSASSLRLTDNCNTCKLPVFLAERLKIGSKLFHRICFKCARCAAQLTPGNQYETENGEHCCEVCPDEEGSLTSSITSLSPNISSLKISEILDSDASVDKIQEEKSKRIERFPSSVQSLISRFDTQAARSAFFTNELRSRFEEMPPNAKEEKEDEINSVSEKAFDTIKENEQSVSTNGIPESQPKLENTTDISIIHQKHSHCNPFEEEEGQPSSVSGLCSSNMEDDVAEPSVINSSAVEKEDVVSELEIGNKSDVDSLHSEDVDLSAQDMHNVDLPFVAEVGDDVQTGSADKTPIENSDESEVVAVLPVASPRKRGKSKTKLAEYPESLNPFDDGLESEDQHMKLDDKAEGTNQEKGSLTLNPFEEEDEDFDDTNPFAEDVISVRKSPVPLPRKSLESSRESSYPYMRSPSPSLSIGSSISMTPTLRKRLTPISPMTDTSRPVSPASTIGRYRKVRRAPPPPIEKHPPMEKSPLPDLVKMNQSERNNISDPDIVSEEFRRPGHNKNEKDKLNENRKSSDSKKFELPSKDSYGQWKRKKGPAPPRPFPQKRQLRKLPMRQLQQELQDLEIQQSEMERQGVSLERQIRAITESNAISQENNSTESLKLEAEDLILQLFDIVNEKNELLRRQTELMYLKRQQRLEEEYVELEYQIRCLLDKPENSRTEEDKKREEELIQRLVLVVERRAEIVDCLELERRRGEEEDTSIKCHLEAYNLKHDSTPSSSPASESKQTKSKFKSPAKLLMKVSEHKKKHKQEGETQSEKKTKIKWFKK